MNIQQKFIKPNQFSRPGLPLRSVSAIAIHYAGDPTATAQDLNHYFNGLADQRITVVGGLEYLLDSNGNRTERQPAYASSHFDVGIDGAVVQNIPESEWAYCTNQANEYSLSIETCHQDSSGRFSDSAEQSLIELTASLCKKYHLDPLHGGVIRHYDVTNKCCPKWYVDHPECWAAFKQAVSNCVNGGAYVLPCSGKVIGSAADPDYCDTISLLQCVGMAYQFRTGSPIFCADDSFEKISETIDGGYYLTKFQATKETEGVGFYVNGKRKCVGVIQKPYSDTPEKISVKSGKTYQFKTNFPCSCGSGCFQQIGMKLDKGYYYTKFKAVGAGSAGFYCGSVRISVGTVI